MGTQREARDTYGLILRSVSKGSAMPTVSAHVALTLARHIDHVFGVMGNGNAYFLDALERSTDVHFTAVRHEAGGVVAADASAIWSTSHGRGPDVGSSPTTSTSGTCACMASARAVNVLVNPAP